MSQSYHSNVFSFQFPKKVKRTTIDKKVTHILWLSELKASLIMWRKCQLLSLQKENPERLNFQKSRLTHTSINYVQIVVHSSNRILLSNKLLIYATWMNLRNSIPSRGNQKQKNKQ